MMASDSNTATDLSQNWTDSQHQPALSADCLANCTEQAEEEAQYYYQ